MFDAIFCDKFHVNCMRGPVNVPLVSGAIAVGVGDEDLVSALMEFVLVL